MKYSSVVLAAFLATAFARPYAVDASVDQWVTDYVTKEYVVTVDDDGSAAPTSVPAGPPLALSSPTPSVSKHHGRHHRHHHHSKSAGQPLETSFPAYAPVASPAPVQQNLPVANEKPQPSAEAQPEVPPTNPEPAKSPEPKAEQAKPSKAPESSSGNLDDFAKSVLDLHNKLRAEHSAAPLKWSDKLTKYASDYLKSDNCVFKHSNGPYGENIAMGCSSPTAAVQAWYDEVKDYNKAAGQFSMSTGHYTQLVWKGTTELGCAQTQCGSSGTFLICSYNPPGNMIGDFQKNVS